MAGPALHASTNGPPGYYPDDIRGAYELPSVGGSGAIAVIDAYDYSTALNDFNVFANQFDLRPETSTDPTSATNEVFQVVYQGSTKPVGNASWNQEAALDMEWSHAMSRYAKIYLVEANSSSMNDLFDAVKKAATLPGVRQISMSFGADEFPQETLFDSVFTGKGITYYASAGDSPGVAEYPAMSPNVVAVGGTTLTLTTSNRVASETAWSGTGGGISVYETAPPFQSSLANILGKFRGGPDVSLNADPNTGCAMYDSTPSSGMTGWMVFGGTSLSTPSVAGIANVSGRNLASSHLELEHIYQGLGHNFRDIISGSAGPNKATVGWDLCTGAGCPLRTGGM